MLTNIESSKSDLAKLAVVLNQFKSEAVQVKLLERLLQGMPAQVVVASAAATAPAAAPAKRRGRPPGKSTAPKKSSVKVKAKAKSAGSGSGLGATGALSKLIETGFFKARRSISDVAEACKNKLNVEIAVTNLSGPLMRFVTDKRLVRAKNKANKFVYWAQ